jgi:adenylate cyclase class 2
MYEVEVKARLRNREQVIKKLNDLGCTFSEELHQIDSIFIPEGVVFPPPLGVPVLRVRQQNNKSIFTLKIPQSSKQDCIERELEISDGEKMLEVIRLLKYQQVPTVEKKRIKTNYKDMEIVLDIVERLGEFIEVEKIVTDTDPNARMKIQEELFAFLAEIGVTKEDNVIDGKYDIMLYEKFGME